MQRGFYCKNEAVVDNAAETVFGLFFFFCVCCAGGISEKFLKKKFFFKSLPIPVAMCKRYRQS